MNPNAPVTNQEEKKISKNDLELKEQKQKKN